VRIAYLETPFPGLVKEKPIGDDEYQFVDDKKSVPSFPRR
jgi:hypothetical protein